VSQYSVAFQRNTLRFGGVPFPCGEYMARVIAYRAIAEVAVGGQRLFIFTTGSSHASLELHCNSEAEAREYAAEIERRMEAL
jgi:hypothetical protein